MRASTHCIHYYHNTTTTNPNYLCRESARWTSWHTINRLSGGDAALPMSHTCFFQVDLPDYTTEARLRQALLTAMHYSIGGILNG